MKSGNDNLNIHNVAIATFKIFCIIMAYVLLSSLYPGILQKTVSFGSVAISLKVLLLSYIVFFTTYQFTVILRGFLWDYYLPKKRHVRLSGLLVGLINLAIYVACFLAILSYGFGKDIGSAIAATGAVGVVLGFGLQKIVSDLFIGISLDMDKSFRLGDWIRVKNSGQDIVGFIEKMNWRSISVQSPENMTHQIPNNIFGNSIVTNLSKPSLEAEFELKYQIPYYYNEKKVMETIMYALEAVACTGKIFDYKCRIDTTTLDGVIYKVKYMLRPDQIGPGKVRHFVNLNIFRFLRSANIHFATNEFDIRMLSAGSNAPVNALIGNQNNQGSSGDVLDGVEFITSLLKKIDLFQSFSKEHISQIANATHECYYQKGDVICAQGDMGQSLYIIKEGLLKVFITDEKGGQKQVAVLIPEDFFGEMSLLTGAPRSATVIAESQLVAYELKADVLMPIFATNDKFHTIIAKTIAERESMNAKLAKVEEDPEKKVSRIRELEQKILNFSKKLLGFKN